MSVLLNDAASEYIYVNSVPLSAAPLTMACKFYQDDLAGSQAIMFMGDKDSDVHYFELRTIDSGHATLFNQARFNVRSNVDSVFAAAADLADTANQWYHIAGTVETAGDKYCYLNGVPGAVQSSNVDPSAIDRVAFGAMARLSVGSYLSGGVAEAAIWNVVLTQAEISSLAAGYSPLLIRPQRLVAYWPLIREGAAGVYKDIIGGLDTTESGGSVVAPHPRVIYPDQQSIIVAPAAEPPAGIPILRRRRECA